MGNTPTLEKWQHAATRTITLDSGAGVVEVEPVDNTDLIYGDPEEGIQPQVPNELAPIAEKVEFEGISADDLRKLPASERIQLTRYRHWLIAHCVRSPKMTPKDVRKLPYGDQIQLFRVITHSDLAERLMLASFRDQQGGESSNGDGTAAKDAAE